MKKIKIGIPRALMYYRYGVLWKNFFELLGCKVILSPKSNEEILSLGISNTIDECCLSYKLYVGHVLYLSNITDYVLVPRICDYGQKDKVCTRFNGIYDDIKCNYQNVAHLTHFAEISKRASELKKIAKKNKGSSYVFERRKYSR